MLIQEQTSQLNCQKHLKVAVIGGSNSAMRDGYVKTLKDYLNNKIDKNLDVSYFALGGVTNLFGLVQNCRYKIAASHDVILFEYCVNDRAASPSGKYTYRMVGMALEGFIRQARSMNPRCIIIILIFGANEPAYYNNCCQISALYESVARRYQVPVINLTEILLSKKGIKFIKALYKKGDNLHYESSKGTNIVGKTIAQQIIERNLFDQKNVNLKFPYRLYQGNLQNLNFFSDFDSFLNQNNINKSLFKNRLFEENIYTISHNSCINLNFKGRLLGIMLKSDWYDGLLKIKLGEQELITSSFSKFVIEEGMNIINLLSLPYKKSMRCEDFQRLSLSVYQHHLDNYELDLCKLKPKVSPENWKISIIGIAYIGEIRPIGS